MLNRLHSLRLLLFLTALPRISSAPIVTAGQQLTVQSFKDVVQSKDGDWFIEFYSPYCVHCKHFAPTWHDLVVNNADLEQDYEFTFGQVDCVSNGDLCSEQNIKGYPSLFYYVNGKQDQEFKGSRDQTSLEVWIKAKLASQELDTEPMDIVAVDTQTVEHPAVPPLLTKPSASSPSKDEGEKQLRVQAPYKRTPNETGTVLKVDTAGLEELLDPEKGHGPAFVKFYAPWCGHCKKLAPTWIDFAALMKSRVNVVEVNCEDPASKAACAKNDIAGYPTLRFFSEGHGVDYNGPRGLSQMEAFAMKAAAAQGVRDIAPNEIEEISRVEDVFFLYLYPQDTPEAEVLRIHQAQGVLLGAALVYKSSASDLFNRFNCAENTQHLITFKAHNLNTPYAILSIEQPLPKSTLSDYFKAKKVATLAELTSETSADYLENRGAPLVVILPTSPGAEKSSLQNHDWVKQLRQITGRWINDLALRKRVGTEVVFTYVNADEWASWLKSMYSFKISDSPTPIIAFPTHKQYWITDSMDQPLNLDNNSLFETLEAISAKRLKPKSSYNMLERFANQITSYGEGLVNVVATYPYWSAFCILSFFVAFLVFIWRTLEQETAAYGHVSRNGQAKFD